MYSIHWKACIHLTLLESIQSYDLCTLWYTTFRENTQKSQYAVAIL